MRARLKRRERNRRLIIVSVVVVIAAVVVIGAYALSNLQAPSDKLIGAPVSSAVYQPLYRAAQTDYGTVNASLLGQVKPYSGAAFMSGAKPVIVYIGADYCPYCAFQRWAIVVAMMRFGNFTNLHYMESSSTEVYPNSPTFTFYGSTYKSDYVVFQPYEEEDRSQNTLQTPPANYTAVFQTFGGSFPFLDFANKFVVEGSFFFLTQLDGKNWTQIVQTIGSGSDLSNQVLGAANAITATVCKVTGGVPGSVCGNAVIASLSTSLTSFDSSPKAPSLNLLIGSSSTQTMSQVYQVTWQRKGAASGQ